MPFTPDLDINNEIDAFKRKLGTGYKRNHFIVTIKFPLPTQLLFWATITSENMVTSTDALGDIASAIGFPLSFTTQKDGDYAKSGREWVGLAHKFQTPGYTLEHSGEIMKWAKYAKNSTKGALTIDFYNDQWNTNYQFWRNYTKLICDGRTLRYPDEYMCSVTLQTFDHNMKNLQLFKFERCYPNGVEDVDHGYEVKDLHSFKVDINWQDFSVKTEKKKLDRNRNSSDETELINDLSG